MPKMSEEKKKTWIAITGSIASGKSSVMKYLKEKGYHVVDCDAINFDLQRKKATGYQKIVDAFGTDILDMDQNLDRKKLAHIIFSDASAKKTLEEIMHPLIFKELEKIRENSDEDVYVEVPLLFELGWENAFDESWLIVSPSSQLMERCVQFRNMNQKEVESRLASQMDVEEKKKRADVIINNTATLFDLYQQIDALLERRKS